MRIHTSGTGVVSEFQHHEDVHNTVVYSSEHGNQRAHDGRMDHAVAASMRGDYGTCFKWNGTRNGKGMGSLSPSHVSHGDAASLSKAFGSAGTRSQGRKSGGLENVKRVTSLRTLEMERETSLNSLRFKSRPICFKGRAYFTEESEDGKAEERQGILGNFHKKASD